MMSFCVQHVFHREKKGNFTLSSKEQDSFLSAGFSNWKNALEKFRKQEITSFHIEAPSMSVIRETLKDVGKCSVIL